MITEDQPAAQEQVDPLQVALQQAVDRLTQLVAAQVDARNIQGDMRNPVVPISMVKQVDLKEHEVLIRLMFVHIQALTELLIKSGVLTGEAVQGQLANAFNSVVVEATTPRLLVPKH